MTKQLHQFLDAMLHDDEFWMMLVTAVAVWGAFWMLFHVLCLVEEGWNW